MFGRGGDGEYYVWIRGRGVSEFERRGIDREREEGKGRGRKEEKGEGIMMREVDEGKGEEGGEDDEGVVEKKSGKDLLAKAWSLTFDTDAKVTVFVVSRFCDDVRLCRRIEESGFASSIVLTVGNDISCRQRYLRVLHARANTNRSLMNILPHKSASYTDASSQSFKTSPGKIQLHAPFHAYNPAPAPTNAVAPARPVQVHSSPLETQSSPAQ